jgi:hypothetical protein
MQKPHFTQEQLIQVAKLSNADIKIINGRREEHNKLGFAYQLCYIKLFNRLPIQNPLEILDELATFVAVQLDIPKEALQAYATLRQATVSEHQESLRAYLHLEKYNPTTEHLLKDHLFQQAQQIQATEALFLKATEFLKEQRVLNPSEDTIKRLIQTQREKARASIYAKIASALTPELKQRLDNLLIVGTETYSKLYQIKEVPKKPSVKAMQLLSDKLIMIEQTGVLSLELEWLNNNYKRYLSKYVTRCDASKLRELTSRHRYAVLICFLQEAYQDTKDHIFDMYRKAVNRVSEQAERTVDELAYGCRRSTLMQPGLCLTQLPREIRSQRIVSKALSWGVPRKPACMLLEITYRKSQSAIPSRIREERMYRCAGFNYISQFRGDTFVEFRRSNFFNTSC